MANNILGQLFQIIQGLRTDSSNLNRDLDERDDREETGGDLTQLFRGFGQLRSIMSKLDESDIAKLQDELKKLMSGKENILEYSRDVNNILIDVQKRTEKHEPTRDKVADNIPAKHQDEHESVGSMFDSWRSVIGDVQHWIEQNSSNRIGSR
jgi:hypothetical protein